MNEEQGHFHRDIGLTPPAPFTLRKRGIRRHEREEAATGINLPYALITLSGFILTFTLLWVLIITNHRLNDEIDRTLGALRLLMALPLVGLTVWISSVMRPVRLELMVPLALVTGSVSDWMVFEGLSSIYGELPNGDVVETVLNALMVLGLLALVVAGEREGVRRQERERHAAELDPLTGLLNRQGVARRYRSLLPGTSAALVMFDLNDLKSVNDMSGHGAGDAHITAVGQAIDRVLPGGAFVGRWGGDEFVALLPGASPEEAERLVHRAALQAPRPHPNLSAFAAGIAHITAGERLERALAVADQRMYEHKAQEREGEARTSGERVLVSLEEFSTQLELLQTPDEVLNVGLSLARDLLGFEASTYYELQREALVLTHYKGPRGHREGAPFDLPTLRAGDRDDDRVGLIEMTVASGHTRWSSDYPRDPSALPNWVALGLKSVILAPVSCRGQVVGALGLANFSTWRAITPQVRHLMDTVALRLSHSLEHLRVVEEARVSLEGGVLGLGQVLEARDLETAGHTERVVTLAEQLGQALGLDDVQLGDLRQGAYLHDIGKLAIPDAVLLKPGRLDPAEWALMQTHTTRGIELASRIPSLSPRTLDVIRHHHERWDGLGYPAKLVGEHIPLLARIFAVCDVYDALTSERPYKRAWSRDDALAEIESQGGKQFDPQVVQALLSMERPRELVNESGGERTTLRGAAEGRP